MNLVQDDSPSHALVSGGAGFIGSHLCAELRARGWRVTAVDNLVTGTIRNLDPLRDDPGFNLLEQDVLDPLPDLDPVDAVFHLASPASVPDYVSRPLQTLAVNSTGTERMLEIAHHHNARFLFASTSEIYGDPLVHPQPETYWGNVNSLGPRSCYDESKRFGEALVMSYCRAVGVDARIVRIFNTYGPHSRPDDGRIVPNFVTQALHRLPITVYGDGTQTRSLCYVSDLVAGILAAMFQPNTTAEVFNLGNPEEHTVQAFAEMVASTVGSDAGIVYRPLPIDDPTRRCPDITRARHILQWEPRVSLEQGLAQTVEWFRELMSQQAAATGSPRTLTAFSGSSSPSTGST